MLWWVQESSGACFFALGEVSTETVKRTCTGVHGWYRLKWNDAHRSCNSHCVLHLVKIQVMRVDGRKGQITSQERFPEEKNRNLLEDLKFSPRR